MSMQQWWNYSERGYLKQVLIRRNPCSSAFLFNPGAIQNGLKSNPTYCGDRPGAAVAFLRLLLS
jgi:hypothetical protein